MQADKRHIIMGQLAVMRRANGELFTLTLKRQKHIALWPSWQSAIHYKARNPELLVFLPALAGSAFGKEGLAFLQKEGLGLFLFDDTGDAHFRDGRKISWEDYENRLPASPTDATSEGHADIKQLLARAEVNAGMV